MGGVRVDSTHQVFHDDTVAGGEESQDHADEVLLVPRQGVPVPRVLGVVNAWKIARVAQIHSSYNSMNSCNSEQALLSSL